MPELPEVETTVLGIRPHIQDAAITHVIIRCHQLRWPIIHDLNHQLQHQVVRQVSRRGKYIIIQFDKGSLLIHLGMSGRLCLVSSATPAKKHDHVDFILNHTSILRYTDPRRFGAILWTMEDPYHHVLLKNLGPEPLTPAFQAAYLFKKSRMRRVPIKPFIMDSKIVVGVGNIYAAEALFSAKIHPACPASQLTLAQCEHLVQSIKDILNKAIATGGSTLKDFFNSDGKPGYFTQQLQVYGRKNERCSVCQHPLESIILGQRSTVFCAQCQQLLTSS